MAERLNFEEFGFLLAFVYAGRGTCNRLRAACVIFDQNKCLVSAGYNGALSGDQHCDETDHLLLDGHCVRTLHSEDNALHYAKGRDCQNGFAFISSTPCIDCVKKLIRAGIKTIFYTGYYANAKGKEFIEELTRRHDVKLEHRDIDFLSLIKKVIDFHTGPGGVLQKTAKKISLNIEPES